MFSTKSNPTTKEEPPNQAHTRKPCTDTQKSPCTQDNANQPKQSCIHTTAPKDPHVDTAPHPPSDGQHKITPSKRAPTPHANTHDNSLEHTTTLPPCTQENLHVPAQKTRAHSPKSILRRPPNSKWKTPHPQKIYETLPHRHSPAPTRPHHPVHTKTPTCPHRALRKPAPRAPLQPRKPLLSREDVLSFIG